MKKKILKASFVAAFAMIAGYTAYYNVQNTREVSDTILENVDALAFPVYENGHYMYDCDPTGSTCGQGVGVNLPGKRKI